MEFHQDSKPAPLMAGCKYIGLEIGEVVYFKSTPVLHFLLIE